MTETHIENNILGKYKLTLIPGPGEGWEWQGGGKTRAVVDLSQDISPHMPKLSRVIEACAYNVLAFRHNNIRVVVEKKRIFINDIENETEARAIMDWLSTLTSDKEDWHPVDNPPVPDLLKKQKIHITSP